MARAGRPAKPGKRTPYGQLSRVGKTPPAHARALYIISADGSGCVKIGISHCTAQRAKDVQTSSPFPVRVCAFWNVGDQNARVLERAIHRKLFARNVHAHGEWFKIPVDVAESVVEQVASEIGINLTQEAA